MTPEQSFPPGLFGVPPGADFATAVIAGLEERYADASPEVWGSMTLIVNAGRMARLLRSRFDAGPPRLVPRILAVSELDPLARGVDVPSSMPRLTLVLHLAQLLDALTDSQQDLAPKPAIFDLAHSLADLIDELEGEGHGADTLDQIDVDRFARHWQRGRAIVRAAYDYIAVTDPRLPGGEARRRRIVDALVMRWAETPPKGPVIVAGSTGSRGATRQLMRTVAALPGGAIVLPGFDFDMPDTQWRALDGEANGEDHPQYRYHILARSLEQEPWRIRPWTTQSRAPDPARNRLLSLALCPAPVTDRWRTAAPDLPPLEQATANIALLAAPSPRLEAAAIALRLRRAVADGQRAALITPDRDLSRQVAAMLERWQIEPDDSAGTPLQQTPPGRLLRLTARMMAGPLPLPDLISLLKHPLAATGADPAGGDGRGPHLLATRELEMHLRHHAVSAPDAERLRAFGATRDGRFAAWADWVATLLDHAPPAPRPLQEMLAQHLELTEHIAGGSTGAAPGTLWDEPAGLAARDAMRALEGASRALDTPIEPRRYADLLHTHLSRIPVTDPRRPHPDVMIWGTLEARAGGVDLAILAGLNDGTWPDLPPPDPWLNRAMRREAGLLLPERRIGLAAHDFQQAIAASQVLLSRAVRDAEAETVPSRWLNRLTTLLTGLGPSGAAAFRAMEERGRVLLDQALALETPPQLVPPARRPAPRPPVAVRPRALFVTRITTLIRDPYAIYSQYILNLRKLAPLLPTGDSRERGIALHEVMEAFLTSADTWRDNPPRARTALDAAARKHLARLSADPAIQTLWHARLMSVADRIITGEMDRLARGTPVLVEGQGSLRLETPAFTLSAKPDRIDRCHDGTYAIHDYKSGAPPTAKQVRAFDKQLTLEAAMAERGAFDALPPAPVSAMGYIALGASGADRAIPVEEDGTRTPEDALAGLRQLIASYDDPARGYTAQRAAERMRFAGDYDHLSRLGEWDLTQPATPEDVGPMR
ncbi:MAG: double-strand break repair protein AddB [Pseudomonadota bacterium]